MGTYTNYSGKGSTSPSRSESIIRRTTQTRSKKTPMLELLNLLEEVESCREDVALKKANLDSARKKLEKAEQKVSEKVNELDPETKARFRRMMGSIDEKER